MPPLDFTRRHYQQIIGDRDAPHPIDRAVAAIPEVKEVDALARAQAKRMRRPEVRAVDEEWVRYEDLRLEQRLICQERFFDAGFEHGLVAGRADSLRVHLPQAAAPEEVGLLGDLVREAVLDSSLPRGVAVAILLELARAFVLEPGRAAQLL